MMKLNRLIWVALLSAAVVTLCSCSTESERAAMRERAASTAAELARRDRLPPAEREALEASLKANYAAYILSDAYQAEQRAERQTRALEALAQPRTYQIRSDYTGGYTAQANGQTTFIQPGIMAGTYTARTNGQTTFIEPNALGGYTIQTNGQTRIAQPGIMPDTYTISP